MLPAQLRRSLGLRPGDQLVVEVDEDNTIRLTPRRVLVERYRGAFADLRGATSVVDELIAERRAEAAAENEHQPSTGIGPDRAVRADESDSWTK